MSERLWYFESHSGPVALALPIDYRRAIDDWAALRRKMVREVPAEFTRDEWAYLVTFLEAGNLLKPFTDSFGVPVTEPPAPPRILYRPRGAIAVWLPNNVSLLGR